MTWAPFEVVVDEKPHSCRVACCDPGAQHRDIGARRLYLIGFGKWAFTCSSRAAEETPLSHVISGERFSEELRGARRDAGEVFSRSVLQDLDQDLVMNP